MSLMIGVSVAAAAVAIGVSIGLVSGYVRLLDVIVMRVMDGLMAIPALLLAIAFVSLLGGGFATLVFALTIPEIPRVVRLVRSVVLSVREEPYVEVAITGATPLHLILWRHVLPNTVAPIVVLATYVAASAILIEASLSFLGAGVPPEIPSWGNVIAEGRVVFEVTPRIIFAPSAVLALAVLSMNVLGDGLRETLDPRIAKRL
jgi:peptide/nickel transport system permease protein